MANTLTIDLDDSQAITSLDQMITGLGEAQTETEALAASGQKVVEQQTQQITVIQKQTVEMKTFATTGVEAMRDVAVSAIETAGKIGLVIVGGKALVGTIRAVKGAHQEKKQAVKDDTEAVEQNNSSMLRTIATATPFVVVMRTLSGEWSSQKELVTAAGSAYAKYALGLTQLTTIAVGVIATIKVMDALNEKLTEIAKQDETTGSSFADMTEKMRQTRFEAASMSDDFSRLGDAAAGAGANITRPFAEVGKSISQTLDVMKEDFSIWSKETKKYIYEADIPVIGSSIKDAVQGSETYLRGWENFFENWVDEARGNFVKLEDSALKAMGFKGDDNAANYVAEAKSLRELAAENERLNKIHEEQRDGFEALGAANRKFDQAIKDRARSEEISAVKTVADVDKMQQAARKLASDRVQNGYKVSQLEADQHQKRIEQIDEETEAALAGAKTEEQRAAVKANKLKELSKLEADYRQQPAEIMYEELNALEQRRTQIIEEEKNKRIETAKQEAEQIKRAYDSLNSVRTSQTQSTQSDTARDNGASEKELHDMRMRWIDEEAEERIKTAKSNAELIEIEADAEKKRIAETESFRRDEMKRSADSKARFQAQIAAQEEQSSGIERARAEFADSMELSSLKLKLDGQQNLAAKTKQQIEDERQRRLAAAEEIQQKTLDLIDKETQRNIDAAKTVDQERKAIADGEMKRLRQIADYDKQTKQEAHDHEMKLAEDAKQKKDALTAAKVDALKPNAEAIIGMQSQQDRIRELQRLRGNSASDKAIQDAGFNKNDELPSEVKRAAAKAEQDARRRAVKDAMSGNVGADEQTQVASNLADKTIQQFAKNGKITGDVVDNQRAAVQAMAQQQANADALSRQVKQVKDMLDAVINASDPTRNRAGVGGQRG